MRFIQHSDGRSLPHVLAADLSPPVNLSHGVISVEVFFQKQLDVCFVALLQLVGETWRPLLGVLKRINCHGPTGRSALVFGILESFINLGFPGHSDLLARQN